jgi:regulator of RNase E activity RraA
MTLTTELVDALCRLDACSVSNAIETFEARLRNEGFSDGSVRAVFEDLPPTVGHVVTARIRCSTPPLIGHGFYDRTDWWTYVQTVPPPRIVVAQDVDESPGTGALVGEVHAEILRALGCVAYVTNGSVRDLPAIRQMGFQCFAGRVSVSHAFVHLIDFGEPVTVTGLDLRSGEILYGDRHGLLTIPSALVADIPAAAERMRAKERAVVAYCRSPEFSLAGLRKRVRQLG